MKIPYDIIHYMLTLAQFNDDEVVLSEFEDTLVYLEQQFGKLYELLGEGQDERLREILKEIHVDLQRFFPETITKETSVGYLLNELDNNNFDYIQNEHREKYQRYQQDAQKVYDLLDTQTDAKHRELKKYVDNKAYQLWYDIAQDETRELTVYSSSYNEMMRFINTVIDE